MQQITFIQLHSYRHGVICYRCCSLESPKKLRFASGNHLESHTDSVLHHRSDEYLMEVISPYIPNIVVH